MRRKLSFGTILVGMALATSACGILPGLRAPTPTPIVTETPTPPPTPTFTPAPPTLTPTPSPPASIIVAERHLRNGNFRAAVATFEQILAQAPTDPELRAAAEYGLGVAALRQGLFEQAEEALSRFIANHPDDERLAWAYFLRGDARMGLSEWNMAIADFERYLQIRPGLIDSYVHERIGDAYLAMGRSDLALSHYAQAVDAGRNLPDLMALRERVALGYIDAGRPLDAVAQYDAILAQARNTAYRAEIEYLAGQAYLRAGASDAAYERFSRVIRDYPDAPYAYHALVALLDAGFVIDGYLRGRILFNAGDYQGAIDAFYEYSAGHPTEEIPPELHLYLGRAYREIYNFQAAYTSFQTIIDNYPDDPLIGEALLEQGRTLFLSGDTAGAIVHYVNITEAYPELPEGAEALWRAAYLLQTLGETERALATYEILAANYPQSEQAWDGLFRAGMLAYEIGDWNRAERIFGLLSQISNGSSQASAYLWLGKLRLARGDGDGAHQAFTSASQADPGGYYSARAAEIISGMSPCQPPAGYVFEFDDARQQTEAENWLLTTFGLDASLPLWPLGPELAADPRIKRGEELWNLGHFRQARAEFESLREDYHEDPLATYQLAIYFRDLGLYRSSIFAAADLLKMADVDTLDAPPFLARLRFPIYYADLVIPAAEIYEIDPLLVFAVIRQESYFEAFATSSAAAQGLMQVIPSTGEYVADRLGWADYQNEDLYRPYVSVAFGTYYLSEQLTTFGGDVYAALAAYNAGPGRAANWLELSHGDPDLFVELVSLDEPQAYIRRVVEQYSVYRALYGVGG